VISVFIGVAVLGEYTNYVEILNAVSNLLALFFISLTSIFGHLYAQKTKSVTQRYFELFHFANFVLGIVFFLGYYAVIDDVIAVLFSEDLLVSKSISMTVSINGFVQFMRRSTLTFRDATGTFYHDRWKPLAEGLVNVVMSVLLVKTIGVAGVIAATIVTNLAICHIVEPYVLYKYAFETSPKPFYLRNYAMILAFIASLGLFVLCQQDYVLRWQHFFVNGFLAVGIALAMCAVMLLCSRPLRQLLKSALHR
jgi:O-antigen/teichoic acid export membrane protein